MRNLYTTPRQGNTQQVLATLPLRARQNALLVVAGLPVPPNDVIPVAGCPLPLSLSLEHVSEYNQLLCTHYIEMVCYLLRDSVLHLHIVRERRKRNCNEAGTLHGLELCIHNNTEAVCSIIRTRRNALESTCYDV